MPTGVGSGQLSQMISHGQTRTDSEPRTKTEHKRDRRPRLSVATFYRIEEYWTNKQGTTITVHPCFQFTQVIKRYLLYSFYCFVLRFFSASSMFLKLFMKHSCEFMHIRVVPQANNPLPQLAFHFIACGATRICANRHIMIPVRWQSRTSVMPQARKKNGR